MRPKPIEQPLPVMSRPDPPEKMRDIAAVEPLALHHERFGPDRFFNRAEQHVDIEHVPVNGMSKPAIIDPRHSIARAEDDVDRVVATECLAQPMRESQFDAVKKPSVWMSTTDASNCP